MVFRWSNQDTVNFFVMMMSKSDATSRFLQDSVWWWPWSSDTAYLCTASESCRAFAEPVLSCEALTITITAQSEARPWLSALVATWLAAVDEDRAASFGALVESSLAGSDSEE
jgi:hypothetical protein